MRLLDGFARNPLGFFDGVGVLVVGCHGFSPFVYTVILGRIPPGGVKSSVKKYPPESLLLRVTYGEKSGLNWELAIALDFIKALYNKEALKRKGDGLNALVYLADDDPGLLEVFSAFLDNAGFDVLAFPTGDALADEFARREPDLVVLDVMMPGTDGLTVCKNLRAVSDVPIVILTAKDSEMDYMHGLAIGADDYLIKPFSPSMLVMRAKALLRRVEMSRSAKPDAQNLAFADIELSDSAHEARAAGSPLQLTMTEFALLRCLLEGEGSAVSRDTLLSKVWGFDAEVETRVTDETVRRVRRKLRDARSSTQIKAVWGYGYKLESADEPA